MSGFKLIDYPHCAICEHSDQYSDDTLICTINDDPDNPDDPLPYIKCDSHKLCQINLTGYIIFLTKLIKEARKDEL